MSSNRRGGRGNRERAGGGGNVQKGFGTVQYGGKFGKDADSRVYAKYFNQRALLDFLAARAAAGMKESVPSER